MFYWTFTSTEPAVTFGGFKALKWGSGERIFGRSRAFGFSAGSWLSALVVRGSPVLPPTPHHPLIRMEPEDEAGGGECVLFWPDRSGLIVLQTDSSSVSSSCEDAPPPTPSKRGVWPWKLEPLFINASACWCAAQMRNAPLLMRKPEPRPSQEHSNLQALPPQ